MYFKVLKDGAVADVLDHILYVRHQKKHNILLLCGREKAQAVLSSNGNYGWHIAGLYNFPPDNRECEIVEIAKYEYDRLKKSIE